VARLWPAAPHAVEADRPVREAVAVMRGQRVGCILVTRQGRLVGLFTERDLLARVLAAGLPLGVPLAECMTADPVTVAPKDSVNTALARMQAGGYRHLPVVDEAGRPVGVLSAKRIVRYLAEHFPATAYCQPPAGDPPDSPEGA
jgi:CBS domain-containing protein